MQVVTDIKIVTCEADTMYKYCFDPVPMAPLYDSSGEVVEQEVMRELIKGNRFVYDKNGEYRDIVIGWSKEVQELLCVPFEAFDTMSQQVSNLTQHNNKLLSANNKGYKVMHDLIAMSWWGRLKLVFTGFTALAGFSMTR